MIIANITKIVSMIFVIKNALFNHNKSFANVLQIQNAKNNFSRFIKKNFYQFPTAFQALD